MKLYLAYLSIFFMTFARLGATFDPEFIVLEERIVDALKNSWCSEEKARLILEFVVANRPAVCVEVGAFTGSSTLPLLAGLQHIKQGRAYVIDAWSTQEAIQGLPEEDPNTIWWGSLDMQAIQEQFNNTMASWSLLPHFKLLSMSSKLAVEQLPAIDFLHLDGNFSEEGALLDTQLYLPKVAAGGHILISNILTIVNKKATKIKALWPLFEQCEIACELENGNAILFKKK